MKSETVYEIELKGILTKEQYEKLLFELPKKLKQINEETLHTTRYRPRDVRFRHSSKTTELVIKEGDPTRILRKETRCQFPSKEHLDEEERKHKESGAKADPPWVKHKHEFEYVIDEQIYVVCLQDIKNFAYIMEAEMLSEKNNPEEHEPNLRKIFMDLGVQPIDPKDFSKRIAEYIAKNK